MSPHKMILPFISNRRVRRTKMLCHIDGDILKYRCGFAAEAVWYYAFGERFRYKKDMKEFAKEQEQGQNSFKYESHREAEPVENALHNVKSVMNDIMEELELTKDEVIVYFSGESNFRNDLPTQVMYDLADVKGYKANRKDAPRPIHGPAIIKYIKRHYTTVISDNEEADDTMAINHYKLWKEDPDSSVIVTIDKDLLMIPGMHYNFVKKEHKAVTVEKAMLTFYRQLLTGDSTDNIPGIPGIGPKTAAKILPEALDDLLMYHAVLEEYVEYYGMEIAERVLLENARMLWIRRHDDELWMPPAHVSQLTKEVFTYENLH